MWVQTVRSISCVVVLLAFSALGRPALAGESHKLALQISDNDAEKMTATLNIAANVSKHYAALGEDVEIQIVAFNGGVHMLRADTSPVRDRLQDFKMGMPNVSFKACDNTLQTMARNEGTMPLLVPSAELVPAGVVTLMELSEKGWAIVRP